MKMIEVSLRMRIIGAIGGVAIGFLVAMTCLIGKPPVSSWIAFSIIVAGILTFLLYLFPEIRKEMKKKSFFLTFTIPHLIMSIVMLILWHFS
jgi:hypothetical protein